MTKLTKKEKKELLKEFLLEKIKDDENLLEENS
jgi:hypothetical protein